MKISDEKNSPLGRIQDQVDRTLDALFWCRVIKKTRDWQWTVDFPETIRHYTDKDQTAALLKLRQEHTKLIELLHQFKITPSDLEPALKLRVLQALTGDE